MKAKKLIITVFAIHLLSSFSAIAVEKNGTETSCQQEQPLVLKLDELYGEKVVKVSFNGESAGVAKLSVFDAKGNIVYYVEEFELVSSPNFNTVAYNQLPAGELTFVVSTKVGSHKAVINL